MSVTLHNLWTFNPAFGGRERQHTRVNEQHALVPNLHRFGALVTSIAPALPWVPPWVWGALVKTGVQTVILFLPARCPLPSACVER